MMYIAIQLDQVNGIIVSACTSPSLLYMHTVHVELKALCPCISYSTIHFTFTVHAVQCMLLISYALTSSCTCNILLNPLSLVLKDTVFLFIWALIFLLIFCVFSSLLLITPSPLQSRASLQELAAKLRTEVVDLDGQLDTERSYRSKAEQENSELKELWENEVKAKHKITEKVNRIKVI